MDEAGTLLRGLGHDVQPLGVHDDLGEIRRLVTEWKPHIAFNLLEGFDDITMNGPLFGGDTLNTALARLR